MNLSDIRNSIYNNYTRGVYYTDWAIGEFIKRMKKKSYFNNTVFVFVGDHGIWCFPDNKHIKSIQKQEIYFRMPLILYAPEIISPKISEVIGSQVDFAPTLFDLLGINSRNSFMGHSLLKPLNKTTEIQRFVLMQHVRQWNLRIGNNYIFDVGREFFYEHFPPLPSNYKMTLDDSHVYVKSNSDLLHLTDRNKIVLGEDNKKKNILTGPGIL
ncbi:MAG: hypothetical protein OMM_11948 [Candidatus Magnetoglobus multicellularis str. Araruama]|uniref:Sulfatase N-terminal domain-containing protein n=1 Tax=Candidatus Magnetoglobus multicellularis str. Araruama TaxID=890399 RepID=A0A1V1NX81_9BACT|nr:MAG: hypothetical protein OMM_11948 [Candidatus Magnetoglobus multicellularis str. Araruama]